MRDIYSHCSAGLDPVLHPTFCIFINAKVELSQLTEVTMAGMGELEVWPVL